jgi:hypothetical protein
VYVAKIMINKYGTHKFKKRIFMSKIAVLTNIAGALTKFIILIWHWLAWV